MLTTAFGPRHRLGGTGPRDLMSEVYNRRPLQDALQEARRHVRSDFTDFHA